MSWLELWPRLAPQCSQHLGIEAYLGATSSGIPKNEPLTSPLVVSYHHDAARKLEARSTPSSGFLSLLGPYPCGRAILQWPEQPRALRRRDRSHRCRRGARNHRQNHHYRLLVPLFHKEAHNATSNASGYATSATKSGPTRP